MNILIVAEGRYPDFAGGAEIVVKHLCDEFVRRGHEVHTLTRGRHGLPEHEVLDGVQVHRYPTLPHHLGLRWLPPVFSPWAARRHFGCISRSAHLDAIILNHPLPALGVLSAGGSRTPKKISIVHSPYHVDALSALPRALELVGPLVGLVSKSLTWAERMAIRRSDRVVTLSQYMKQTITALHGEPPHGVTVVPGGVDLSRFYPAKGRQEKRALRRRLGMPADSFLLLAAKRLHRGMGLECLIDAMGLLARRDGPTPVHLAVVGDGPLRPSLARVIERLRLGAHVSLVGTIRYEDMGSWYRAADALVSARQEPFGLATLEALATGLPVFSVPTGGTAEIIRPLSRELFFRPDDPSSIAQLVIRCLDRPHLLDDVKSHARSYVRQTYSWSDMASAVERIMAC